MSVPIAATAQPLPRPAAEAGAKRPTWRLLLRLLPQHHMLSWADQAVVSATSFVALIMIARWTDASELGTYAVAGSVLAVLLGTQESLVTKPYSIQLHRPLGTPAEHAFSSLLLGFLLSVAGMLAVGAAALALIAFGARPDLVEITWTIAWTMPFVLMREFVRRFAFAHLRMLQPLMLDLVVAALQLLSLAWLGWTGRLSAVTALAAVGISCGIGALGWLYLARSGFAFRLTQARATLKQSWQFGKWLLSGQLALQAQGYMTYWLSLVIAGAAVTGIYTACMSIVSFANPVLFGFFNILTPRSVRILRLEGGAGLRRQAARDSLLLAALMSLFCVLVFVVGEIVFEFLYPGAEYQGYGHVLVVLTVAAAVAAIGAPASVALASAEHPRAVAAVMTATALLNVLLVWWFMSSWGLLGAAYGILVAEVAGSLARWMAFLTLVPANSEWRPEPSRQENTTRATVMPAHASPPPAVVQEIGASDGPGRILLRAFETLDGAGIRYCILHGYEDYPRHVASDVDCIIERKITPAGLYALLNDNAARIGAEIVRCRGYYIVLAGKNADGTRCFLALDFSLDAAVDGLPFYPGDEVLESRRRHGQFWIPAPDVQFGCYLARSIAKARLDDARTRRLESLYRQDAAGCEQQVARFWDAGSVQPIVAAARSGDWSAVQQRVGTLQAELRRRTLVRSPLRFMRNKLRALAERIGRLWRPDGLYVVLLGPDGAGKSSVVEAVGPSLSCAFTRWTCWGFAPSVLQTLLRRPPGPTDQPHGLPPRSFLTSVMRAGYWFIYYTLGYPKLRFALARSTLVLNDRHFVDILIDVKRYRYGGPLWLLRLIWRVIPKPDLVILLDAPPEVLQARKQEVSFEETARQCRAYLSLVRDLKNGHVVDANQPLEQVAADVSEIILHQLATRIRCRFGAQQKGRPQPLQAIGDPSPADTRT